MLSLRQTVLGKYRSGLSPVVLSKALAKEGGGFYLRRGQVAMEESRVVRDMRSMYDEKFGAVVQPRPAVALAKADG